MGPLSLGLRRVGRIQVRVTVRVTVPVTSRARLTKSGSFLALRPPLRPVAGVLLTSQAAPPALAPLAPATGRSPPPRLQSSAPRLRHRLPSSPRACGPRAAAAAHHFGSCLAFVASSLQSAARASRSQRVRSRQGILPVKTLGGGVLRVVEVPFAQTFDGSPP
jgi:hypothetical protein